MPASIKSASIESSDCGNCVCNRVMGNLPERFVFRPAVHLFSAPIPETYQAISPACDHGLIDVVEYVRLIWLQPAGWAVSKPPSHPARIAKHFLILCQLHESADLRLADTPHVGCRLKRFHPLHSPAERSR